MEYVDFSFHMEHLSPKLPSVLLMIQYSTIRWSTSRLIDTTFKKNLVMAQLVSYMWGNKLANILIKGISDRITSWAWEIFMLQLEE